MSGIAHMEGETAVKASRVGGPGKAGRYLYLLGDLKSRALAESVALPTDSHKVTGHPHHTPLTSF